MPFRSPIERRFIADLITTLDEAYDVRSIGIDLIFDQPTVDEQPS
jgi:CHASE2 domain-containing sensor protein